jgi:anaerobic ribonucleoside-triphosphate reductase activating protein
VKLHLSRLHFPVTTLGPGRRIGIWFQGCSIRCPGCVSMDTWAPARGATTVEAVLDVLSPWCIEAEGITISGGEPFDQPHALEALLKGLRHRSMADILVFTGYAIESLQHSLPRMAAFIDALVSDPFEAEQAQTKRLRGSDNQRLHFLTAIGRQRFAAYEQPLEPNDRVLDIMLDDEGTAWLAGIPRQRDLRRLAAVLTLQGHVVAVSEGRSTIDTSL